MARPQRMLPEDTARAILSQGTWGVLSTVGPDGAPYAVPVNYFYAPEENALYFHCALQGRKVENIRANPRVAFTVVTHQRIIPEKLTTHYCSAIALGRAAVVEDPGQKADILARLCRALAPGVGRPGENPCPALDVTTVVRITVEELTGKANRGE